MFEQALLTTPGTATSRATLAVSLTAQILFVGTALVIPLFFIEGPGVLKLSALLMAPAAPPPPPHMELVKVPKSLRQVQFDGSKLFAPHVIPRQVAMIEEDALPPSGPIGVTGGTGKPGDPNIGSFLGQLVIPGPPPPPQPQAQPVEKKPEPPAPPIKRVTVSSGVQAAKIVSRVLPIYPPLAKQARISGTVKLMGVLNRDGRIMQLQVISGHPLLVKAAVDAVSQWIYQPTLLNGEPVEVIAPIDVNFVLGH